MSEESKPELEDTQSFIAFDTVISRYYEIDPQEKVAAIFAAATHRGNLRENNEDNFLVVRRRKTRDILLTSVPREFLEENNQQAYVMAIADGLGGRNFGEMASFLALRTGWELGGSEVKWTMKVNEREVSEFKEKAHLFFQVLHRTLNEAMQEEPRTAGMGTTLTICYTTGPNLFVMHTGDCRAYLVRAGKLRKLTKDHTVAQRMIDEGLAEPGSKEEKQARRLLTRGLGGGFKDADADITHLEIEDGDRLMLCSDGLSDMVDEAEVERIVNEKSDPAECCQTLVETALAAGGKDNVTVLIGQYRIQEAGNAEV